MARYSRGANIVTTTVAGVPEIQELVLDSMTAATPLRISGRSRWMDAGRPVSATRIASLAAHRGIVDYVPGDLTMTVRAGTTLREIAEAAHAERQWLPLDPFGASDGTIGATIATGSFGPLATGFGRARDLILGVEFITGDGKIVRGGGKVVKNVAGFDLVRLVTGSWGTIGIVTEATLRLYSLPSHEATLSLGIPDSGTAMSQRVASVLSIPGSAFAVEIVDQAMAGRIGLSQKPQMVVRLGGNYAAVAAQRAAVEALGGAHEMDPSVWEKLRVAEDSLPGATVLRISSLPKRVAEVWNATRNAAAGIEGAMMHATPALGVVRCILPEHTSLEMIDRVRSAAPHATVIFERLPHAAWATISPSVTSDRLSQGIKRAFDPSNILNPGILGLVS